MLRSHIDYKVFYVAHHTCIKLHVCTCIIYMYILSGRQFFTVEEMLFSAHHASYEESLEAGIHCFLMAIHVSLENTCMNTRESESLADVWESMTSSEFV